MIVDWRSWVCFDLFHSFFHRVYRNGNMVVAVLPVCVDSFRFAELDSFFVPAFAGWLLTNFSPHMHFKYIFKKFLGVLVGGGAYSRVINFAIAQILLLFFLQYGISIKKANRN